ncbi:uncharacterized protein E0L32_000047 [Thyridium curvatum]|uniref:Uncharacterized protein n=1 Tax=Thyridium curvatum TaxID=1093900 RepID=A0A507B7Q0_9PEZI|nr:uncharacterized protein E0L32_000047 [Thyridium curvatum]TPX15713.1 hypothetical protein E0L32_000047 [Thyridium curvatum]
MESFAALKRRTTDLLQNLPQSIPNPIKGHGGQHQQQSKHGRRPAMKGTWERIAIPSLPRSSHSLDVVAGTAYVFGGEAQEGGAAVDNDMHAIVLPFSSAPADYYTIKAVAAPPPIPIIQEPAVPEGDDDGEQEDKPDELETNVPVGEGGAAADSKELSEVDLTSGAGDETPTQASSSAAAAAAADKGKGKAVAAPEPISLGDVPAPRVGHATAVIGSRIFVFGGRPGGAEEEPLDERGRVWVFDTKSHQWSALDPAAPSLPDPIAPGAVTSPVHTAHYPAARSAHCAVATDKPEDFAADDGASRRRKKKPETWREWAEGDSAEVGTPQRPIVGNVGARARDHDADGYGTLIVHGGVLAGGRRAGDTWAFDVRSRVWQELPRAPGAPRAGAGICISKSRLYRFGGEEAADHHRQIEFLELGVDTFDDRSTAQGEVTLSARGTWQTLLGGGGETASRPAAAGDKTEEEPTSPLKRGASSSSDGEDANGDDWPGARSAAGMQVVTTGGGREYLVLLLGQKSDGSGSGSGFWDDAWAFQVPPLGMSAASVTDAVLHALGRRSGEGTWTRVETAPYDDEDDDASAGGPGARGWVATSPMLELEENGVVVFGGRDGSNTRLGDGWIFRLG